MRKLFTFLLLCLLIAAPQAYALDLNAAQDTAGPSIIVKMGVLAGLALMPFIVMLLTSYLKIVIVLSLLRNALGTNQTPPSQVISGIALLMSIYVMYPTGHAMFKAGETYVAQNKQTELFSSSTPAFMIGFVEETKEPLRDFLFKNTIPSHIKGFLDLAKQSFPAEMKKTLAYKDFIVLIPAYITSQLKSAFEISVLIYLPFFVIDLVTSNILLAMGMMMLSPLTIALPLKLLLIVLVDGWTVIIQGLVGTFNK